MDQILYSYFRLDNKINQAKQHLETYERDFWSQSFTYSPLAIDENGNKLTVKPFYEQVDQLVDTEAFSTDVVNFLRYKKREFNRYLISIDDSKKIQLTKRYLYMKSIPIDKKVVEDAVNECNQIEEASGYRYGFTTDKAAVITDNYGSNLQNMLAMFAVN